MKVEPIVERTPKINITKDHNKEGKQKSIIVITEAHGVSIIQCQRELRLDREEVFFRYHLGIRETHNQCELSYMLLWQTSNSLIFEFLYENIRFLEYKNILAHTNIF